MRRVVITGVGAVTPIGYNTDDFWQGLKDGKHGFGPITKFDASELKVSIAAEINDFDPETVLSRREARRLDNFSIFAIAAAKEALKQSGYEITEDNANAVGTIMGSGIGGFETIEEAYARLESKGVGRLHPLYITKMIPNMSAGNIAMQTGARGASYTMSTACASGTNAIGEGFLKIAYGLLDACFVGGSEASLTKLALGSFDALTAMSNSSDPDAASRPFDKDRDGFVPGEGSGILFIESLDSALERGATILAEIVGYGTNSDAYHPTAPRPDGEGAALAMIDAMKMANIEPEAIDYINAHGTSTPTNDTAETASIKQALGDHAYKIPVSSIKGNIGHLLGAAGGIEAVATVKSLQEGYVPATMGLKEADEACDLDYVPGEGRHQALQYALSNSLGFGGHNASILLKRWDGDA